MRKLRSNSQTTWSRWLRPRVRTGIDVPALVDVSLWLEELLGRRLEGYLYRAARWP